MKSVLEWYENIDQEEPAPDAETSGASIEQTVSIEKEVEQEQETDSEQDHVQMQEYENCIKAIGISEFLRNKLSNYLAMTQVSDFDSLKKDELKNEIKYIVDELSRTTSEL